MPSERKWNTVEFYGALNYKKSIKIVHASLCQMFAKSLEFTLRTISSTRLYFLSSFMEFTVCYLVYIKGPYTNQPRSHFFQNFVSLPLLLNNSM